MEEWKKIYENGQMTFYSVSNTGRVRNDQTGKILKASKSDGYLVISISLGHGNMKRKRVHRLVAEYFIPNPENKPFVNHIDGKRDNDYVENLEWVTPSENMQHARKTGLYEYQKTRPVRQYNLNGDFMMIFESATEAARQCDCDQSKIIEVCRGNRKTAGYYQWRYDDELLDKIDPVPIPSCTKKRVGQYDKNDNLIAVYESYKAAARAVDGTSSAISRICSGTPGLHTHKGFKWKIVEDIVQEEI